MEGRKPGKKMAPGVEALANRLGASTVVMNTLQRPVAEEHLFFLKEVAEQARAILDTIRKIEEGHVDEDFAFLGLDTCALVYIIINECDKIVNRGESVPEKFKWEAGEMQEKVQVFMDKKIARGVFKRIYKQSKDQDKVESYRERLKKAMPKFGVFEHKSIQEVLEQVISEKVLQHDIQACHAQGLGRTDPVSSATVKLAEKMVAITISDKPLPVVLIEDIDSDREDARAYSNPLEAEREERMRREEELRQLELKKAADEERRKVRLAQELQRKKAEKERWRRSEQEFSRLPDAMIAATLSPVSKPLSRPTSPQKKAPSVVISDSDSDSEDDGSNRPARSSTSLMDQLRDEELARRLQEEINREAEDEKRKNELAAYRLAQKLRQEWDEEDEELSESEESDSEEERSPSLPPRRKAPSPPRSPRRSPPPRRSPSPRRSSSPRTPTYNHSPQIPQMAGPPFGVIPPGDGRRTLAQVKRYKDDLAPLEVVVGQVEFLDDAGKAVKIQNRQEQCECEKLIEDSVYMGYLAVQYCVDVVTGGERVSKVLKEKIKKLEEALKAAGEFISEADDPDEGFNFNSERAVVDRLLSGCLASFDMGAFCHIQGAYENARKNIDRGLKRRITLTIAPSQEPKKTKEPRRHTGPNENTGRSLQDQGTSRMLLETRSHLGVIDISDSESDVEKKTSAPTRKPSKANSAKRKETTPTSSMNRQSSTSSQRSHKGWYHTTVQQGSIHEEPDEIEPDGSLNDEVYRNLNREDRSSKPHREVEGLRDQRRMKTAPAVRVSRQDSFEDQPPSYSQTSQSQMYERRDTYHDPRYQYTLANPQYASPVGYGPQGFYPPPSAPAPPPSIQSPLDVIPHLFSRFGPNTNVRIEDSFNVGSPTVIRKKKNRRETDGA
ncbi:hypothetical protein NLJ89_g7580 [Agrocybe chaxingu]|uniref:Uncharacterized protein n=1 Tax=Agrocybe chaxingu TaxID=84603 RepID=A0A9W8MVB1_9AGAR|nr:hypothetical protein NLJ89_g7580 [Agrocybe chaxingu]